MGQFGSKGGLKRIAPIRISREEIRKSIRVPLPVQTGGRHKDARRKSRQEQKIALRRGES
jgi:hypothetical protein